MMTRSPEDARTKPSAHSPRMTLRLERTVHAPARARAAVSRRCEPLGLDASLAQSLILLVSEVVSNAVRHSEGDAAAPIEMAVSVDDEKIRVTVTDAGNGFVPRPRDPSSASDGYGLYLLEKVAACWGVESEDDTKVWFELLRAG